MSIKTFFKDLYDKVFSPEPTVRFKSIEGAYNIGTPVQEARKVIPHYIKKQVHDHKENRFARCPGMFDLAQAGYIMFAHKDIHIKANKQGVIVKIDGVPPILQSAKMDYGIVEGLPKQKENVCKHVVKIPLPWAIFCKKGYSNLVLPATLHAEFLDKVLIYPGIVDHDTFHTINCIITVTEECEFTIYGGTPLLQIIPYKREKITAECGKANQHEVDQHMFKFYSRQKNFYRKFLHSKKLATIKQV